MGERARERVTARVRKRAREKERKRRLRRWARKDTKRASFLYIMGPTKNAARRLGFGEEEKKSQIMSGKKSISLWVHKVMSVIWHPIHL